MSSETVKSDEVRKALVIEIDNIRQKINGLWAEDRITVKDLEIIAYSTGILHNQVRAKVKP